MMEPISYLYAPNSLLPAVLRLHALAVIQNALADAQVFRRDLQQLVVREEFHALLQTHLARRHEAQRLVGAGSAHVRELLFLADVDGDVLRLGG